MLIQISSGQGPAECGLAVKKLYESLKKEYKTIELLHVHTAKSGRGYASVLFSSDDDLSYLEGTVQWICQSPYRPHHKRKNWFVDVSVISEVPRICKDQDIRFDRFHCGGNGGQNVNKVETGVRLTHVPTGITVTAASQRSQLQNRHQALNKLNAILAEKEAANQAKQTNDAWKEHMKIIRGNPVRIYKGKKFILQK